MNPTDWALATAVHAVLAWISMAGILVWARRGRTVDDFRYAGDVALILRVGRKVQRGVPNVLRTFDRQRRRKSDTVRVLP